MIIASTNQNYKHFEVCILLFDTLKLSPMMCESAVDSLLLIEKGKHKSIPSSLASCNVGQVLSAPVSVYYCLLAEDKIDLLSPQILVLNFLLQYIHL